MPSLWMWQSVKRLPLLPCYTPFPRTDTQIASSFTAQRLKFNSPETGSEKTLDVWQVTGLGNTRTLFRPSWMRCGEEGMGSDGHISYSNQSSDFCLCVLTALPSSWRRWLLKFTPSPKLPSFCVASFSCSQSISLDLLLQFPLEMCQGWIYPL